jgi:hypothetical protein
MSSLGALLGIITSGVSSIESAYAAHGQAFPSLDEPFRPAPFDESKLGGPRALVVAAAAQLIASLAPPQHSLMRASFSVGYNAPARSSKITTRITRRCIWLPQWLLSMTPILLRSCAKQGRRLVHWSAQSRANQRVSDRDCMFVTLASGLELTLTKLVVERPPSPLSLTDYQSLLQVVSCGSSRVTTSTGK